MKAFFLMLALAAEPRPMNVEDVLALSSVSDPQISPYGKWVAYVVSKMDFEENINDSDVWLVSSAGGERIRLTSHLGADESPRWSPDSTWLAFISDRGDERQVFGIRPDGGEAWPVTDWKPGIESFIPIRTTASQ